MARARVTIVQSEDEGDARRNLGAILEAIREHAGSDLVVFPELALHGHDRAPVALPKGAGNAYEQERRAIDEAAASCGTSVIYGGLLEREGALYNVATYTDGNERVSYAKTHVHWSERFSPGTELPVVHSFRRPLGMLICFDAAFPEVARVLALSGAEIIVNLSAIPSSFPLKHVHRRVVACSVQNQVFTVFANRAGEGFEGGSAVVDPEGETIALAGRSGALIVDVDLADVERWRAQEPLFPHRRVSLYKSIAP